MTRPAWHDLAAANPALYRLADLWAVLQSHRQLEADIAQARAELHELTQQNLKRLELRYNMSHAKTDLTKDQQRELANTINAQHAHIKELEDRHREQIGHLIEIAERCKVALWATGGHRDALKDILAFVQEVLE